MSIPLNTIYSYFETGDFPTQEQFQASWSSFWHKDESIPTSKVTGLESQLQNKADKSIFESHISNPDSHASYLAKKDASNLDNTNIQAWKTALGVGNLPTNIATVDDGNTYGNVYSKDQSNDRFLTFNDYVNDDRKILAEKIEALGLTTLIEAKETNLPAFAGNSASYQFEDNDFIAIPDSAGNFSLYMFKGGEKTEVKNYLPTGISNVTIGMVEGLQAALNEKVNKPATDGKFYIKRDAGVTTTEVLPDETLATVVNRNNYCPKGIAFTEDKTGSGNPGTVAVLGINRSTYSFSFGNINANHTGTYNIAWGYNTLPAVTSGQSNTVVGHFAGKDVTTGTANVIMGVEAGTGLVTGTDNTLIGTSSGYGLKEGTGNTMLGKWTGCFIAGANNTFLGYQAGQYWGKGGTGLWSSNVVIGGGTSGHGNGIWGENNLILGSNIELIGAQNNKFIINNFLRKDNNYYKTHFIEGNFADRWLRFDTSLQVLRLPVADATFTKNVVAKPDGTFGVEEKQTISQDYIPLAGTSAGKPVKGTIEFAKEGGGEMKSGVASIAMEDGFTFITSTDIATGQVSRLSVSPTQVFLSQNGGENRKYINLSKDMDRIDIGSPALGPGIVGSNYYGANYTDNSFVQKKWVDEKLKTIRPGFKIYKALMYVDRYLEPKFTVLENTLGDIVWKREDTGRYMATLQGAFPTDRTWINSKVNARSGKKYAYDCLTDIISDDALYLHLLNCDDVSSPTDIVGQFGVIEIYVYD
ncbi:hypothetical protein C1637_18615 [Chryseobacterium lactis]|uniref:Tail fiber protein n=1 Tax=Chryseobacterium lactis TaxID=1241981 RepID=A0A3G6RK13_CHRLC|nr:hypothetical protein [Chryseobacterium lactis]AZA84796.1 hypothetical protein EG342_24125 [Chryseobacterium lactis]AZB05185.1 hypothetical protein EG341_15005 [Chryseobacterium lactis]PNW12167.1 hypothetical protein C1637_18615 [Chryseobacterium lactis]